MITEELKKLYIAHTGHEPEQIDELPSSGSNRRYFRLIGSPTLIGVSGESVEENRAFLYMAEHFRQKGLPVRKCSSAPKMISIICKKTWATRSYSMPSRKAARPAYSVRKRNSCCARPSVCCPPYSLPEPTAWTSPTATRRQSSIAAAFCGT